MKLQKNNYYLIKHNESKVIQKVFAKEVTEKAYNFEVEKGRYYIGWIEKTEFNQMYETLERIKETVA